MDLYLRRTRVTVLHAKDTKVYGTFIQTNIVLRLLLVTGLLFRFVTFNCRS